MLLGEQSSAFSWRFPHRVLPANPRRKMEQSSQTTPTPTPGGDSKGALNASYVFLPDPVNIILVQNGTGKCAFKILRTNANFWNIFPLISCRKILWFISIRSQTFISRGLLLSCVFSVQVDKSRTEDPVPCLGPRIPGCTQRTFLNSRLKEKILWCAVANIF